MDNKAVVRRSREDPIFYIERVLREKPWSIQKEIAQSVLVNKRTAVKSCHGAGKSYIAARLAVWFVQNHVNSVVLTTAPSFQQVNDVLWKEIRLAWTKANKDLVVGRLFDGQPRLEVDRTWFASGFSTDDPDNFQGTHAPHVLIIFDEACGISPSIWRSLDGNLTSSHVRFASIGNPIDPANPFRDECSSPNTNVITVSAFDTPNFTKFGITEADMLAGTWQEKITGRLPYPDLVTPEWVAETIQKYGHESAYYQSRVSAEFPEQSSDSLIRMSMVTQAKANKQLVPASVTQVNAGVDVARTGDDETVISAFAWHHDTPQQVLIRTASQQDTEETADQCLVAAADLHSSFPNATITFRVDADGLGAGVYDKLNRFVRDNRARYPWFKVHEIRNGARPRDAEAFLNSRAEMWWSTRTLFEEGRVGLMDDPVQESQLVGIKWRHTPGRDQVAIERKDEAKRRGLKSPDRADALMMALAAVKRRKPIMMFYDRFTGEITDPPPVKRPEPTAVAQTPPVAPPDSSLSTLLHDIITVLDAELPTDATVAELIQEAVDNFAERVPADEAYIREGIEAAAADRGVGLDEFWRRKAAA